MTELTAEHVVDGREPRTPALSPDGRWVAFAVAPVGRTGPHPVGEVWLAPADGGAPPRRLTGDEADESRPRWSADSGSVFFLSDAARRGTPQLRRVRLAGGRSEELTTWRAGLVDHLPLADPALVAVIAHDGPAGDDDPRVWGERVDAARLRLLDLRTGVLGPPHDFGGRHVVEVARRPDGGPLAVLTWQTPDIDPGVIHPALHLVDGADTRDLGTARIEASSLVWWHDDDWRLAYLGTTPPGLVGGRAVFDLEPTPAAPHRNLTAGLTSCPTHLAQAGTGVVALFADGLDTAVRELTATGFREVLRVTGSADSPTASPDAIALVVSTAHRPADVHAGPLAGPLRQLSHTRPELDPVRWGGRERLAYRAADGLPLDGLLLLPPGRTRADGPFPMVTLAHGGPYGRYADRLALGWYPSGQWLATAGYAVFLPNPRGGEGHGHEFAAAVAGAVGLDEWDDVVTGIDLLVAEGVADPDRLGIGGWSHGGFTAAWAVTRTDRFRAALVGAGITDWGMLAATGEGGAFEAALAGSTGWEGVGPHPHDRLSPISYATRIRTPVLIVHGEDDTNVPVSQAEFLHRALRRVGVEHEYVVYPRENHPISERAHQLDLLRRTRAWFDRWLLDPGG